MENNNSQGPINPNQINPNPMNQNMNSGMQQQFNNQQYVQQNQNVNFNNMNNNVNNNMNSSVNNNTSFNWKENVTVRYVAAFVIGIIATFLIKLGVGKLYNALAPEVKVGISNIYKYVVEQGMKNINIKMILITIVTIILNILLVFLVNKIVFKNKKINQKEKSLLFKILIAIEVIVLVYHGINVFSDYSNVKSYLDKTYIDYIRLETSSSEKISDALDTLGAKRDYAKESDVNSAYRKEFEGIVSKYKGTNTIIALIRIALYIISCIVCIYLQKFLFNKMLV